MKCVLIILCAIIGLLIDIGLSAQNVIEEKTKNSYYRLNKDVLPSDYTLEFFPYFTNDSGKEAFTYDGIVTIILKATKSNVKNITLHKEDLEITEHKLMIKSMYPTYFDNSMQMVAINRTEYHDDTKKYSIILDEAINENLTYILILNYTGKLRTDMIGFYRSSYIDGNVTKWLASTKMEPGHARKAFPCFDEPSLKATFSIIINRPSNFEPSHSNTPLVSSENIGQNLVREIFAKTPIMSTYLVAFVVSEFKCRENYGNKFGVCSRPNAYDQTEYSFEVGQKILAKFDEIFNYTYTSHMEKLEMVAIPDFASGAMENWGLIAYRETTLLYDPKVSTASAQQRVGTVVAHEQAHMWFGNLVTCDWWSNLWLNEGFARFYQYFGMALIEESWGLEQQFVVEQLQSILSIDSLENSHALTHNVNTPNEISDRFDSVSYGKGASVIRMFEHTFGKDKFIAALQIYLKENALSTAVPEKLYDAFQRVLPNGLNVAEFMSTWVAQSGYPVLNVRLAKDRKSIVITQRKFLHNNPMHNDNTLWTIPITYASNKINSNFSETKASEFLSKKSQQIEMDESIEWIVFNVQQTGYYRVNYDDATWRAIDKVLYDSPTKIHVHNRAQIVDDALNLARAHQLTYSQALHTIKYLQNEFDYIPWLAAFNNLAFISARFKNKDASIFDNFILDLLTNVYSHLGFYPKESDSRLDIFNRNLVLKHACKLGHKQCITNARNEYNKLIQSNYKIPVDLVPVVYCSVITEGSDKEWNFLWNKFQSENVAAEQVTILNALGCTKKANLIAKYFDLILSDSIRLQDKHLALLATLKQQVNVELVLDFIITHHKNINKIFESENEMPKILTPTIGRLTTSEQVKKVDHFIEQNMQYENEKVKNALKNAKTNLKWAEKNIPSIKKYLQKKQLNRSTTFTISYFVLLCTIFISIFN